MRTLVRVVAVGLLAGAFGLAAAWGGVGLAPVLDGRARPGPQPPVTALGGAPGPVRIAGDVETLPAEVGDVLEATVRVPEGPRLPDGQFLVGANRTRLSPAPELFGGQRWERENCFVLDEGNAKPEEAVPGRGHSRWPFTSPDCIYLGGFGLGPVRPARGEDDGGVWVRSVAISNGVQTLVHQTVDATGYFYRYAPEVCADCGIHDVRKALNAQTGIPEANVVIQATHTHAGFDGYGGWGGVPDWYWNQVRDSMIASAKQAIANLQPATIEVGSVGLRDFNSERRDTYYSNADTEAVWLRALDPEGNVVATVLNYTGHPTLVNAPQPVTATWIGYCHFVEGPRTPILHADWPGAAARAFERAWGGVGLTFEGGLGNVSISAHPLPTPVCDATPDRPVGTTYSADDLAAEGTGQAIAARIEEDVARGGHRLASNEIAARVEVFSHPLLTNRALITLGQAGLFSREAVPLTPGADGPGSYYWSKQRSLNNPESLRGCATASELQIRTLAGAHRIGEFGVAFGPGELFSNIAEVAKERADRAVLLAVYAQANDSLGYIMQSFEADPLGGQPGDALVGEYEETFLIDRCFGDHVLQVMLEAEAALGL